MTKIAVLGSYVLRRAVSHLDRKACEVVLYAPKISMFSLFGRGFTGTEAPALEGVDSFVKEVATRDLTKSLRAEIELLDPDLVVVDFFDDQHDLLVEASGERRLTGSDYVERYKLDALGRSWRRVPRNSEEAWQYWEDGCAKLSAILAGRRVVLVPDLLPEFYLSSEGTPREYSESRLTQIRSANRSNLRAQEVFRKYVTCSVAALDGVELVSQTLESDGFDPSNLSEEVTWQIARSLAVTAGIEDLLVALPRARVERCFEIFAPLLECGETPTIAELHRIGRDYLRNGDSKRASWAEKLIGLIHNSSVPLSVKLGSVTFGYGGIGVIIHAHCVIGDNVMIGSNVTLGGGRSRTDTSGHVRSVPQVGNRVYIATGAKLLGGITIGHHCVIGANAVVTTDVPPFSVVAGVPATTVATITEHNFLKYASLLYKGTPPEEVARLMFGRAGQA